jgi:hypothetical protein
MALTILGAVVLLIAIVSVFGFRPRGGRPVERTHLMTGARVVLIVLGLILLYLGWKR